MVYLQDGNSHAVHDESMNVTAWTCVKGMLREGSLCTRCVYLIMYILFVLAVTSRTQMYLSTDAIKSNKDISL